MLLYMFSEYLCNKDRFLYANCLCRTDISQAGSTEISSSPLEPWLFRDISSIYQPGTIKRGGKKIKNRMLHFVTTGVCHLKGLCFLASNSFSYGFTLDQRPFHPSGTFHTWNQNSQQNAAISHCSLLPKERKKWCRGVISWPMPCKHSSQRP